MLGEIDKDFYCAAGCYMGESDNYDQCLLFGVENVTDCTKENCSYCRRKFPTPEQFKEEYGEEYPDNGAIYVLIKRLNGSGYWSVDEYSRYFEEVGNDVGLIVCACTPFGKPDNDWRP